MASVATNMNIAHMNNKQLHKLAIDVGVSPVTINQHTIDAANPARNTALRVAIKAK